MDEILEGLRKTNNGRRDCLFVVMEEYRKIEPVPMSKGECLAIDQGAIRGGTSGNEAILALRSTDGAWPEEGADISSENVVLAAIKIGFIPLTQVEVGAAQDALAYSGLIV